MTLITCVNNLDVQLKSKNRLKVFISVDMEGISGIVHPNETGADQQAYELGRTLMIGDVNAAIDGILALGDAKIVVSDGHGSMRNLKPEELNATADLVRGSPKPLTQMAGINREFNAALFIGYHSKKGTQNGVLDHTISSRVIDSITLNGLEVGETALNAAIAGYYEVPLVFLSGDLAVTREANALVPNVITVAVKEAISRTAAKCLNPAKARKLIKAGVTNALKQRESIEPPFIERVDGRTISFVSDNYLKAFGALRASIFIASAVSTT
jgi:D-amino peptidase